MLRDVFPSRRRQHETSLFFLTVKREAEKRETKSFPLQPLEMVENFLMRLPILNKISDIIRNGWKVAISQENVSLYKKK